MSVESIMLEMQGDIRHDIYGDIYGHQGWAEEIHMLRAKLTEAKYFADEVRDYLRDGGYLGQRESLIWQAEQIIG